MRKKAKNPCPTEAVRRDGKTMLPPALPNSKPNVDISDLERSEAIIILNIHYFATAYNPCCFHPTRSKSNASAIIITVRKLYLQDVINKWQLHSATIVDATTDCPDDIAKLLL